MSKMKVDLPFYLDYGPVSCWGFSSVGASHLEENLPCQDRCKVVMSTGKYNMIIAAMADGLGSCDLSHYGADYAVETATTYLKNELDTYMKDEEYTDENLLKLLNHAMQEAKDAVSKKAEDMEQLEYLFQSTLTIALYNSYKLYIAHCGDGGVIVLKDDGTLSLVSQRNKGNTVVSVTPLQAGSEFWQIFKVEGNVNAIIMATDGVLDGFVGKDADYNRIYYPFIQPALESDTSSSEIAAYYYRYLNSESYCQHVTDDKTLMVIANQKELKHGEKYTFDEKGWNQETKQLQKEKRRKLFNFL